MISFKKYITEGEKKYVPFEDDYKHVYDQRRKGKSTNSILYGFKDTPALGIVKHQTYHDVFDSPEAQQRPDYHPPVAKWQKVNPRDSDFKSLYRLRQAGHTEAQIQSALKIHKDTVAKYYDSGEAQQRPDYTPANVYGKRKIK